MTASGVGMSRVRTTGPGHMGQTRVSVGEALTDGTSDVSRLGMHEE
jgi:hypothetical protein